MSLEPREPGVAATFSCPNPGEGTTRGLLAGQRRDEYCLDAVHSVLRLLEHDARR